jgi:argininosuccinate synthase
MDRNLMHLSFEGQELEDPWNEPGPGSHLLCVPIEKAPNQPEIVTIDYEKGDPVAVNGQALSPAALIKTLNTLGGAHGIGRLDMVENRYVGMKSRGVYETPGCTILHAAHRDLEGICMDREVLHMRDQLIPRYAEMVYYGYWFSPERKALQALMDQAQERVTGTVRVKLYKGNVVPLGRKSPFSLYNANLATFEKDEVYNQADATGFIRLAAYVFGDWEDRKPHGGNLFEKRFPPWTPLRKTSTRFASGARRKSLSPNRLDIRARVPGAPGRNAPGSPGNARPISGGPGK